LSGKVSDRKKETTQISTTRAYIEATDDEDDEWAITVSIKAHKTEILAGKVELSPRPWIYLDYNEDNDLIINNSPGMEVNKWDHIINETLGEEDGK